ncbi:hypothetical protein CCR75_002165 [Bremia lactucae]|uniref:FHA domain-containing protein n=1 Tax=Bremia lactucae TaxID=4779 RepID=A0A976ID17_BRELC|nr:hypothetical protein CCR75_002165 [Bremia lactucae]
MLSPTKLLPWGRLVLLTKKPSDTMPEKYNLLRSKHCVGRVASRSDIHIPKKFISSVHCIIRLLGTDDSKAPVVEIEDLRSLDMKIMASVFDLIRYGIWVNLQKIGYHQKSSLKNGYVIHFTPPDSKDLVELAYKFEIIPSGLTDQNEELHARLSADEMSVASRTRKRVHEELQSTQSPTNAVSPPRPRPEKKRRRLIISQQLRYDEPHKASGKGLITKQHKAQASEETPSLSAKAASTRCQHTAELASKSTLIMLQEQNEELKNVIAENAILLNRQSKQLTSANKELEMLQKECETFKQARENEIATLKKGYEDELEKIKDQAAADLAMKDEEARKNEGVLRQECNTLKVTLDHIANDPKMPPQVRTIIELEAKIQVLKRQYKVDQESQAFQTQQQDRPQVQVIKMTPPSKKDLVELERKARLGRQLYNYQKETGRMIRKMYHQVNERIQEERKISESITMTSSSLSGSSQSQDSIDNRLSDRRSSQLSDASNEQSVTSPSGVLLTDDAPDLDAKSGETIAGRPPLFTLYGAQGVTADPTSSSNISRPTTLSQVEVYRAEGAKRAGDKE